MDDGGVETGQSQAATTQAAPEKSRFGFLDRFRRPAAQPETPVAAQTEDQSTGYDWSNLPGTGADRFDPNRRVNPPNLVNTRPLNPLADMGPGYAKGASGAEITQGRVIGGDAPAQQNIATFEHTGTIPEGRKAA